MSSKNRIWKPNVTVAAVIERDGSFLFVEEAAEDGLALNQPAGHLEQGESIIAACVRETLEETAWAFKPQSLIGIYSWPHPAKEITYLRFAFCGELGAHHPERPLDEGIVRAVWLTPDALRVSSIRHRSPLVLRCVEDYLAGKRYPLDVLADYN